MQKTNRQKTADPYSDEIKKLVKKTLIVIGIVMILGAGGIVYVAAKSGLKIFPTKQKAVAVAEAEVLSVQKEVPQTQTNTPEPSPTASPSPTPTPTVSPSPTATPTATSSSTPSASPTNTPSPTTTAAPNVKSKEIKSTAALDGYIDSSGTVNTSGEIRVGSMKKTVRGFYSFDIGSINPSEVAKATLRIFQIGVKSDPFTKGTDVRIDLVHFGSSLDSSDYSTSSINPSFAIVSNGKGSGWKEVDVTSLLLQTKQSARTSMQFRLHLNYESENNEAYAIFESGENGGKSNNLPEISIELK